MTGIDEDPVEVKYLGLGSWPEVTASYQDVKPGKRKLINQQLICYHIPSQ